MLYDSDLDAGESGSDDTIAPAATRHVIRNCYRVVSVVVIMYASSTHSTIVLTRPPLSGLVKRCPQLLELSNLGVFVLVIAACWLVILIPLIRRPSVSSDLTLRGNSH